MTQSQDFIVHCEEETAYDFDLGSYETGEEREYSISITAKEGNFILKKTIIYNDNYLFDINFDTGIEQTVSTIIFHIVIHQVPMQVTVYLHIQGVPIR